MSEEHVVHPDEYEEQFVWLIAKRRVDVTQLTFANCSESGNGWARKLAGQKNETRRELFVA